MKNGGKAPQRQIQCKVSEKSWDFYTGRRKNISWLEESYKKRHAPEADGEAGIIVAHARHWLTPLAQRGWSIEGRKWWSGQIIEGRFDWPPILGLCFFNVFGIEVVKELNHSRFQTIRLLIHKLAGKVVERFHCSFVGVFQEIKLRLIVAYQGICVGYIGCKQK